MAEINTKIIYNKEEDMLYLSKGKSSKASIEIGDFIIDIGFDGFVSAIEILNASKNLNIDENLLEKINKASLSIVYKPGYLYIYLNLMLPNKEKEIAIPLTINLGHEKTEIEQIIIQ